MLVIIMYVWLYNYTLIGCVVGNNGGIYTRFYCLNGIVLQVGNFVAETKATKYVSTAQYKNCMTFHSLESTGFEGIYCA